MTAHERGEVVWSPALFAEYARPFLLISTDDHPFHGEEYIGLAITTSQSSGVAIRDEAWLLGTLPKTSFIKPWNPVILKDRSIRSVAGVLDSGFVDAVVSELARTGGLATE